MKTRYCDLEIVREYYPNGTTGKIFTGGYRIADTIELPWRDNLRNVSCIPEGVYNVIMYPSSKHGMRPLIEHVQGRSGILLHPANWALKELRGCIAPVTKVETPNFGTGSRAAMDLVQRLIERALKEGNKVRLTITSDFGYPVLD